MALYCTDADLIEILPENLPTTVDIEAERTPYRTRASGQVDELVGTRYSVGTFDSASQKFPNAASTPSTPESVRRLAKLLAAQLVLEHIQIAWGVDTTELADFLQKRIDVLAAQIREGIVDVRDSAGTQFGGGDLPLVTGTSDAVPVFTRGRVDIEGDAIDEDHAGSLDGLST